MWPNPQFSGLVTFTEKSSMENFILCSYRVTYAFKSECTLSSFLNVKERPARNRPDIWCLRDCNGTRIHNHLVGSSPAEENFIFYAFDDGRFV